MPSRLLTDEIHPSLGARLIAVVRPPSKLVQIWAGSARQERVMLLVDSGAERTCLDLSIVERLEIKSKETHPVRTFAARKAEEMPIYPVALELMGKDMQSHRIRVLPVYATRFNPESQFAGMLGRDVLQMCNLSYRGKDEVFTLEF